MRSSVLRKKLRRPDSSKQWVGRQSGENLPAISIYYRAGSAGSLGHQIESELALRKKNSLELVDAANLCFHSLSVIRPKLLVGVRKKRKLPRT
jgi:hypothetical protein